MKKTSIEANATDYRRGVIFGLTMAEVLLLLIFCLLLFVATLNRKIDEVLRKNAYLSQANEVLEVSNANYQNNLKNLDQSTAVSQEVFDVVNVLDDDQLKKLIQNSEVASTFSPDQFQEYFAKAEKWDTFTNQPQKATYTQLDSIEKFATSEQLNRLMENADIAMNYDSETLQEKIAKAEKWDKKASLPKPEPIDPYLKMLISQVSVSDLELLAAGKLEPVGNNWPPIISLPEAENYSFKIGSAELTENFKMQLDGDIIEEILNTLSQYDADLIEIIGHTDLQPMSRARVSNLDTAARDFFQAKTNVALRAKDNVGLGYARALSVTKHLRENPKLQNYTILPYSAAQMITPDGTITKEGDDFESSQLRRIEIRVRRQNK
jgi:flagellar motor protein MotB